MLSNMNMLSPDSRCFSFDSRANGYARGEGFGTLILKRLSDAIRDRDTIRAVVRSTGSNSDGYTPGITQPSSDLQKKLIEETYRKAGLDLMPTRYLEAHATGTPTGDPIEMYVLHKNILLLSLTQELAVDRLLGLPLVRYFDRYVRRTIP